MSIDVQGVTRKFEGRDVLNGVTFQIPRGGRLALIGPNGSGKSTLMRILSTVLRAHAGDAQVCGISVSQMPGAVRRKIGWAPASDGGFLPHLTGLENLQFHGSFLGLSKSSVTSFLKDWKELGPLDAALVQKYALCSAGMKQCLTLVRAFIAAPDVLLLDEPTRSLDAESRNTAQRLLKTHSAGHTLLMTTHFLDEASAMDAKLQYLKDASHV